MRKAAPPADGAPSRFLHGKAKGAQREIAKPTSRIVISLPYRVLQDITWLGPLEDMTRDELILTAIRQFLKPHLAIRKQVLKSAANLGRLRRSVSDR